MVTDLVQRDPQTRNRCPVDKFGPTLWGRRDLGCLLSGVDGLETQLSALKVKDSDNFWSPRVATTDV